MKLLLEIFQEAETPDQWTARCAELDVTSAHTLPEVAIEAVAEACRMTLQYEMKRRRMSCIEAFEAIRAEVAARTPTPIDRMLVSLGCEEAARSIERGEIRALYSSRDDLRGSFPVLDADQGAEEEGLDADQGAEGEEGLDADQGAEGSRSGSGG